ncbi:HK97-gp10 family putative phage morphogenesis protein [Anaerococcus sp. AGMB09787]|uniref:HK97-gp10 family putative phage morphogenesis protein n=1 Tax=Anaerococcus sp. AGMB09787 TaxID=2922869 RepID=UPI001FAF3B8C|nr:HK97-gp10 family putative phage morphogenesis protein [Anaerococcus sp. AGMB09787]
MKLSLKGDKELIRALKKAEKRNPEVTSKVIKNVCERGKEASVSKAPHKTGFLKSMHNTRYPSKLHGQIISGAGYSGYVNYGTRFQSAQPFFTNAFRETKEDLRSNLKKILNDSFR